MDAIHHTLPALVEVQPAMGYQRPREIDSNQGTVVEVVDAREDPVVTANFLEVTLVAGEQALLPETLAALFGVMGWLKAKSVAVERRTFGCLVL